MLTACILSSWRYETATFLKSYRLPFGVRHQYYALVPGTALSNPMDDTHYRIPLKLIVIASCDGVCCLSET